MTIVNFTPWQSLAGGVLIGFAASLLMLWRGRVMGVTGIVGGVLQPTAGEWGWRAVFIAGMLAASVGVFVFDPSLIAGPTNRTVGMVAIAGLLVGFGTRLGNGCTSGHGVCGLTRGSTRSLVAVLTFMATGMLTATIAAWVL